MLTKPPLKRKYRPLRLRLSRGFSLAAHKKVSLRQKYRAIRKQVQTDLVLPSIERRLGELLSQIDYKTIFVYQSFDGEVCTDSLIATHDPSAVFVPKILDKTMFLCNIISGDRVLDCDVAIVPLIAFSPECFRLGFGGGYYDRFLAHSRAISIGLAFDCQQCDCLPVQAHDVALDYIVTESKVWTKHKISKRSSTELP